MRPTPPPHSSPIVHAEGCGSARASGVKPSAAGLVDVRRDMWFAPSAPGGEPVVWMLTRCSYAPSSDLAVAAWRCLASRRAPEGGEGLTGGVGWAVTPVVGGTAIPTGWIERLSGRGCWPAGG